MAFSAMRHDFVFTREPVLRGVRVSSCRASARHLLSSGGITRHHRYYEVIRLPRAVSVPPRFRLVSTRFLRGRGPGASQVPALSQCHTCHGHRPRGATRNEPWRTKAPICPFVLTSTMHDGVVLSRPDQFRGSIPSAFGLRPACLRPTLKVPDHSGSSKDGLPGGGSALPGRESHPLDNATLPGRSVLVIVIVIEGL